MTLSFRDACSMGLLGLMLFVGCGADSPFMAPDAKDDSGGAGGTARRDGGGDSGTSSFGTGGVTDDRDAAHGGAGARPTEAGLSGSSGTGGQIRDAAVEGGGRSGLDGSRPDAASTGRVMINEIVADPQRDWNDSAGGAAPFDAAPGTGTVSGADEWIELYNASGAALDLSGWSLVMTDGTPATELLGAGDAVLAFSAGGALTHFQAGEYLVIGNPKGDLNNTVMLELYDARGLLVDRVSLGGDGGGPSGNATSSEDEAIARVPDATDTDDVAAIELAE